ncbi:MAG: DUF1934 domain-containing protein [Lachnospiraceae bacterium]|nr:DUF1934 domain-containing protein [Lachnospiraceae bacterium]MDD3616091.1 DUF1934 domain-containing protein [Lachnospiraceae bacterium]
MTRDVIIRIKGLQFIEEEDEQEPVEVVTAGEYFWKNGNHYLKYDEVFEGMDGVTKNLITIKPSTLEVHKKGVANVNMIFEENKKNLTYYNTPFGNIQMGIAATKIETQEEEDSLQINVDYALELNYEYVADCNISIHVQPKSMQLNLS